MHSDPVRLPNVSNAHWTFFMHRRIRRQILSKVHDEWRWQRNVEGVEGYNPGGAVQSASPPTTQIQSAIEEVVLTFLPLLFPGRWNGALERLLCTFHQLEQLLYCICSP